MQYMSIKAIPAAPGHWKPADADWCGRCAESRAEGLKDEDGVHKNVGRTYGGRLDAGFEMLSTHGDFGESAAPS